MKTQNISKVRKKYQVLKDIIFMLLLLLLLLLSTVSASVTQEISCQVNEEVKIDSISVNN